MATLTDDRKQEGLHNRNVFSSISGGWKSEIQRSRGHAPSEGSGEMSFLAFSSFRWRPAILGSQTQPSSLCLQLFMGSFLCLLGLPGHPLRVTHQALDSEPTTFQHDLISTQLHLQRPYFQRKEHSEAPDGGQLEGAGDTIRSIRGARLAGTQLATTHLVSEFWVYQVTQVSRPISPDFSGSVSLLLFLPPLLGTWEAQRDPKPSGPDAKHLPLSAGKDQGLISARCSAGAPCPPTPSWPSVSPARRPN